MPILGDTRYRVLGEFSSDRPGCSDPLRLRSLAITLFSAPKNRDGCCDYPITQFEHPWPTVEDDASDETFAQSVAQPKQVLGCISVWCRVRLDLHRDDLPSSVFSQQVDLVPALFLAEMMETYSRLRSRHLCSKLSRHEGVEHPSEKVAISKNRVRVHTEDSSEKSRIGEISLWRAYQPLQPLR